MIVTAEPEPNLAVNEDAHLSRFPNQPIDGAGMNPGVVPNGIVKVAVGLAMPVPAKEVSAPFGVKRPIFGT